MNYTVYAGTCEADLPTRNGQSSNPKVPVGPGETAPVLVPLAPIDVKVLESEGLEKPVSNATVLLEDTGCKALRKLSTTSEGTLNHPGMPFGTYSLCVTATVAGKHREDTIPIENDNAAGTPPQTIYLSKGEEGSLLMSSVRASLKTLRDERGFTLIELLVAMSLGIIVSGVALSLLNFTTADVTRITERVHADQSGRVALEKLMLALHSSCLTAKSDPVKPESTEGILRFVSETSTENEHGEPSAALPTIKLHEIVYTAGSGKTEGTLTEKSWTSKGVPPNYEFNEKETPTKRTLLTGVQQTETAKKEILPVFRYYRYYRETDGPKLCRVNWIPLL